MDLGRLRKGEWLCALAALALLAVMFLPWFGAERFEVTATAWQAFTVWDLVLALLGVVGLGGVALTAVKRAPAAPLALLVLTAGAAVLLAPALLLRIVFPPGPNELVGPEIGAWLGLLCVVGIGAGAWIALADERTQAAQDELVPAQPTPPEVAPAGSLVAEGGVPGAPPDRD